MKNKIVLSIGIVLLLLSAFLISCENPWMKDILDPLFKEKSIIPVVWIRPGTFIMGSPVGEPGRDTGETQHQVRLTRGFYMGKYQVTQEQYQAVMGSNPSSFNNNPASGENQGKRPVETVKWYDAIVFCNKLSIKEGLTPVYTISGTTNPDVWGLIPTSDNPTWNAVTVNWNANGYRLPTEAEWEYVCRAGTSSAWSFGNTENSNCMWYAGNSGNMTHEVGKKLPNALGLYDMHGNVFEWCWDWYDSNYGTDPVTNPTGPDSGVVRLVRGGCLNVIAQGARSAARMSYEPWFSNSSLGFRLVRQ